jgi:Transposase DDE domain
LTTKIVARVDALGNPVRFVLLPGQRHDTVGVPPLIEGIAFDALLGDKAFDTDWLRAELDSRGAAAVIPPKANVGGTSSKTTSPSSRTSAPSPPATTRPTPASVPISSSPPPSSLHDNCQRTLV